MKTNKLHTIKNTGFKVPNNYFNELEDAILSDLKLKAMAPKSGFKLPDTYFNSLEDTIINKLQPEKETKIINLFTWRKVAYATAIAASLILMINIYSNSTKNITIETIETARIEDYILNEDISNTEFAALFTKEDLQDVQLISDGYSSETLENFVFDNLDIEDIIIK